jgi:hypothetical protein
MVVDLLTQGNNADAKRELMATAGIASALIADKAVEHAPIVVSCDGTRTRIYCTFDDDAIDGSSASESALGYNPLAGNWSVSLPCSADDLAWVSQALKQHSTRVTARDLSLGFGLDESTKASTDALEINVTEFLKA